MKAVMDYGLTRVNLVLAFNYHNRGYDVRYSSINRRWASNFTVPWQAFGNTWLQAHAILVDGFTDYVRKLYAYLGAERFALPGQEGNGKSKPVHGYEITRSIMFSENQGYAIAHNSDAPDEYVCWQFTEDNDRRDYYWGIYGDRQAATDGYNSRLFVALN